MPTPSPLPDATSSARGAVSATDQQLGSGVKTVDALGLNAEAAAVSAADTARARMQNATVEISVDGGEYRGVVPAADWIVDVAQLGILPSNTGSQNSDAIEAAFVAIGRRTGPHGLSPMGKRWQFGFGVYDFARTIEVTRASMVICGVTGLGFGGSTLRFPTGVTGIILHSFASFEGSDGERSDYTVLKDLYVIATGKSTEAHGIFCLGYGPRMDNIAVLGFKSNGFMINASTASVPITNANKWFMSNCNSAFNDGHGMFVQGADVNAGVCIGFDSHDNGGWGIYEDSFLGNTYIGCHSSTNGQLGSDPNTPENDIGGYWSRGSVSFNTFIGCYSEGNEGASIVDSPGVIMGGLIPSGVNGTGVAIRASGCKPLLFTMEGGAKTGSVQAGSRDGSLSYLRMANSDSAQTLNLKYGQAYGAFNTGFYGFNSGDANGQSGLMIAGTAGRLTSWPMAPGAGRACFDNRGFFMNQNHLTNGAAVPVEGTFNVGDLHFNTEPVAGGKAGWICVTSGTAGTYTEGRTAEAFGSAVAIIDDVSTVLQEGDIVAINGSGAVRITLIVNVVAVAARGTVIITGTAATVVPYDTVLERVSDSVEYKIVSSVTITALDPWAPGTHYYPGEMKKNGGNIYYCITEGITAGSGGPSGTSADITDGTAHWRYIAAGAAATTATIVAVVPSAAGTLVGDEVLEFDPPVVGVDTDAPVIAVLTTGVTASTTFYFSGNIPSGAGSAIAYVAPAWKTFGAIDP